MRTYHARRALSTAAVVLVLGFAGGCGDGPDAQSRPTTTAEGPPATAAPNEPPPTPPAERTVTIAVRNGAVVRGAVRVETRLGERLRILVTSDVTDEVHLHGYDRRADVVAGGQVAIVLTADIPGIFEMELERRHLRLGQLVVEG